MSSAFDQYDAADVVDLIAEYPLAWVAAADGNSVRAFSRVVDGKPVDLFAKTGTNDLLDSATGSEWDFSGRAIRGPLAGRQLTQIPVLRDYWFDWRTYHPGTTIFRAGLPRS